MKNKDKHKGEYGALIILGRYEDDKPNQTNIETVELCTNHTDCNMFRKVEYIANEDKIDEVIEITFESDWKDLKLENKRIRENFSPLWKNVQEIFEMTNSDGYFNYFTIGESFEFISDDEEEEEADIPELYMTNASDGGICDDWNLSSPLWIDEDEANALWNEEAEFFTAWSANNKKFELEKGLGDDDFIFIKKSDIEKLRNRKKDKYKDYFNEMKTTFKEKFKEEIKIDKGMER